MASTQQQLRLGEDETGGARAQAVRGTGRGKSRASSGRRKVTYGFHLVEGRMLHGMEDVHVAEFRHLDGGNEVGLFAVFDGHSGADVATYLREHLFDNILNEPDFWTDTLEAIRRAYHRTDRKLLKKTASNGDDNEDGGCGVQQRDEAAARGRRVDGVTVILINGETGVVANVVGDSRAVLCGARRRGEAAVRGPRAAPGARRHREPRRIRHRDPRTSATTPVLVALASDGLWKVMSNQEAVDEVRDTGDARKAAARLVDEAVRRGSKDDVSCIVVKLH
ncbi:hypothetical protein PR202_ga29832 [Eleusine coracana subsp. coracana]|uniref:protein-serine/threonine phosphatase n=1 Tax=Eleusine coracana subsp. coracana TaxID=191504 RepID=A0AAV5DMF4_ELECO|nr:hypothetical protein PR202_ga29832 [Eleusine coracana subsp. coracana]